MFRTISLELSGISEALRHSVNALGRILDVLQEIRDGSQVGAALDDRLTLLETTLEGRAAELEAMVLRADSRFKSSRAAEERARTMEQHAKAYASDEEGSPELAAAFLATRDGDAERSEAEPVQNVHQVVAISGKAAARNAKFGVG